MSYSHQTAVALKRSYRSSHMNNCCCSLHSDGATLDCCCRPARKPEINFTLEFLQTENDVLCLHKYIWERNKQDKLQKNNQCPSRYSGQANKSWIPKLWASLFHVHLKAKVAVYALPSPAWIWACRIDCISGSNTSLCKMTLSPSKSAENPGSGAEHAVRMECRKAPGFSCQTSVRWI